MRYLAALALLLPIGRPGLPPTQPLQSPGLEKDRQTSQQPIICIDPGHPSEVNDGKTIQNGTSEVHVVWVVALKLKQLLTAQGYRVVMTKTEEDQFVTNKERALIANRSNAALLVRLHCDTGDGHGFTLYYPDRQGTSAGRTGPSSEVIADSRQAAHAIHAGMASALRHVLQDNGVHGDSKTYVGARQGALTGSIFSQVPVVTIEMVFLSNKSDAELIKSESGQQKMASAMADGIVRFAKAFHSSRGK